MIFERSPEKVLNESLIKITAHDHQKVSADQKISLIIKNTSDHDQKSRQDRKVPRKNPLKPHLCSPHPVIYFTNQDFGFFHTFRKAPQNPQPQTDIITTGHQDKRSLISLPTLTPRP